MTTTHIAPALMARVLSRAGLYHLPANGLQVLCDIAALPAECLNMLAIARKLGVTTAATTGTIDALETLGLVIRQRSGPDRRVVTVHLTAKGHAALTDILDA